MTLEGKTKCIPANINLTLEWLSKSQYCVDCAVKDIFSCYTNTIVVLCFVNLWSTDQGVGGGFVITNYKTLNEQNIIQEYTFKLKNYWSVFQAKVTSIHVGAKFLSETKDRVVIFWIDSLSALRALSNKLHRNKTVQNCHKALNKLASNNKVYLN